MNNQNEQHTEETGKKNSNTELIGNKSPIRWDVIMTIIGFGMMIYAAIAIPGAGRIVDNEFVPSKFMPTLKGMGVIGLILFLIGIFKWLTSSWGKK